MSEIGVLAIVHDHIAFIMTFPGLQSEGEAASTRALAGSILSRNDRDRDSGLGTPQPGQMEV